MMIALAVMGIGIGPTLVTQYSFGAARSPRGRSATVMTMLGSGVVVGQSIGAAVAGELAESAGTEAALVLLESVLLTLVGKGVLTSDEVIASVETVVDVKRQLATDGTTPELSRRAAGMLVKVANSIAAQGRDAQGENGPSSSRR